MMDGMDEDGRTWTKMDEGDEMTAVVMLRRVEVGDRVYEAGERAEFGRVQAQVLVDLGYAEETTTKVEMATAERRELATGPGGRR